MSGRSLLRLAPLARRTAQQHVEIRRTSRSLYHGLLRLEGGPRRTAPRPWPFGAYAVHNVPAVRSISFVRVLPRLAMKLVRIPALFGGAMIAGLAYVQYQATQAGNYAMGIFRQASDAASTAAGNLFGGAGSIWEQTKTGWETTIGNVGAPEWMRQIMEKKGDGSSGHEEGGGSSGPEGPPNQSGAGVAAAGGATVAAFGLDSDSLDDTRSEHQSARDDQMMLLTKKMIEIRGLLQTVGKSDNLTLPSIVVIGSQSSGKSSVLEAIVGHEFLPKGANMATRRPIELTLVNTPDAKAEYGEFPALGFGKITDFSQIQKTLTDLNLAVPEKECVSDDPIQLRIYSPNVPDLSLIDLPGYIQVTSFDQPTELKQSIEALCDKYIQPPNVILAISAADVDLANSTSLRASRRVDPRGERTIGVITKMDLVDPDRGASILTDRNYPLKLGYVGVVCRIPQTSGLFSRGNANITNALVKNENAFFSAHPKEFGRGSGVTVGITNLRQKLMEVLEQTMSASLARTGEAIHQELAEVNYEYKVQYNDRPLSAESYVAESLDAFKHAFKDFIERFGRAQVREILKIELDQQVLNLLAQKYWNRPFEDLGASSYEVEALRELPKAEPDSSLWQFRLDASTAALTKLGIGRLATNAVANALQAHIDHLVASSTFAAHPSAVRAIEEASSTILKELSLDTSDELEICVKPYKHRIDVEDAEWAKARENVKKLLKDELRSCKAAFKDVETEVNQRHGKKKLADVMNFIDRVRRGDIKLEGAGVGGAGGFSLALLHVGREGIFLRDRMEILNMRLKAISSRQCVTKKNKYYCPEIFLDTVADKLTTTADLFLDAELLSKFYHIFPRELDARLGRGLSKADIERFAREDPKVFHHLELIRRKELLERALNEMENLRALEGRGKRGTARSKQATSERKAVNKGWSLF